MVPAVVQIDMLDRLSRWMRKVARVDIVAILILVSIAAFFRFYRLAEVPIGLWRDEAANGLEALRILEGHHGVFFGTREPMFIYLVAVSVAFLGRNPLAIRIVAAIAGTATIPVTYLLVRELFVSTRHRARLVACLTSLALATSYWHLSFSRLGFRGILLPLLASLSFYFLWRGWNELAGVRQDRPSKPSVTVLWFVVAGICLGLALYTYTPSRFLPLALLPFLGAAIVKWWRRQQAAPDGHSPVLVSPSPLTALAALGLSCLLVFAPLGVHFLSDTGSFFARSGVSVFGADLDERMAVVLAKNVVRQLSMFGFSADPNTRHDPAGRPAFDLATLAFSLMGLTVCIRHWRKIPCLFILSWFSVMLLPAILTFPESPHYLRAIGALPVAYIFPAIGVERMWHWLTTKRTSLDLRPAFAGLLAVYLALAGFFTFRDYFAPAVEGIDLVKAFDPRFVEVAAIMNEIDEPHSVWIIPLGPNGEQRMAYFVIDFLYDGEAPHRYVRVDENTVAQELKKACLGKERAIMLNSTAGHLSQPWFDLYADSKGLIPFLLDKDAHYSGSLHFEGLDLLVYQLPARVEFSMPEEFEPLSMDLGDGLRLTGIAFEAGPISSGHASIVLRWKADRMPELDHAVEVTLIDEAGNRFRSAVKLLLSKERHPTSSWDAGQVEIDYHSCSGLPNLVSERYNTSIALLGPDSEGDWILEERIVAVLLNQRSDGSWQAESSPPSRLGRIGVRLADTEPWVAGE